MPPELAGSEDLDDLPLSPGQERAMGALHFGVAIAHEGYNLYVMGSPGLGKHAIVRQLLEQQPLQGEPPSDWCYVNNFRTPHKPRALRLPGGVGRPLQNAMRTLVQTLASVLPAAFESDEYRNALQGLKDRFKHEEETLINAVEAEARAARIILMRTPTGFTLAPMRDGEVIDAEAYDKLSPDEQQTIEDDSERIRQKLRHALQQAATASRNHEQQVEQLNQAVTRATVERQFVDLEAQFGHLDGVAAFLAEVKQDIIERGLELFSAAPADKLLDRQRLTPFNRYLVNLLVDNSDCQRPPLVYEDYPSYQNLLGRIEHQAQMGALHTDFTLIKGGALHRANGGYLILDARKLLTLPFAWDALKRALQGHELRIQSLEQILSLASTISLEPDPIPLSVKVVLIGDRTLYYLLTQYDPEFALLFKVQADFAEDLPRNAENTLLYARLIATQQRREQLRPLERSALARLIEQAAREIEDGQRLSLHLQGLLDLLREADYWAGQQQQARIGAEAVEQAVNARRLRADQVRERQLEGTLRGLRHVQTDGHCIAQINGLAVFQLGNHAFGHPARITASARLGDGKLIDIEREVELGGALHSKGVLILAACIGQRFGQRQPLSFSASLVFEQSYGGIDGDSASAAELCVLLSALGQLPLRQDLAITGSVDQHGRIQVIGGVNQKIEGFFELCAARGLTGQQGVIIPAGNRQHLMLRREVIEAVRDGRFHLYAIDSIDEAMSLLCDRPAGTADAEGNFPADTVNGAVQARLLAFSAARQGFAHPSPSLPDAVAGPGAD
nr:AAA family ATPase [Pseudomonas sp. NW5]